MVDEPRETVGSDSGDPGPTIADTSGAGGRTSHRIVPGDSVGPFKILSVIGEGGFGIVFLAEQTEPVKRRVALKVIKAGMDTDMVVARFEAERQAVAMMNHPGIAKVFEAGATKNGRPYFVMEYVKGEPLSKYCDKHKLITSERLDLFAKVCDAIQHAHQKGVIHRDLKPGNILVSVNNRDEPQPKVIDFGIAKATSQQLTEKTIFTQQGEMIGTPEYMSPEQAEMTGADIDTRSDVYSLGVILYELLSGKLPFDPQTLRSKGYSEIQRIIREEDPPRPSTRLTAVNSGGIGILEIARDRQTTIDSLSNALRRELEWIPLKALRKDRTERYSSAEALAEDVRRYLRGDALEAGPETASYRMRKFIRRNKAPFTAALLIALALVIGLVGTSLFAVEAARQRDQARSARLQAEQRLDGLRALIGEMSGSINLSVKNLQGGLEVRQRMLAAAEKQLDILRTEAVATRDPLLLHAVGEALVAFGDLAGGSRVASLGDRASADAYYEDAASLYQELRIRADLPEGERFSIQYMLPLVRNRQADLLVEAKQIDDAVVLIIEARDLLKPLAETGDVFARREYNIAFERLGDLESARGAHAAALEHYLAHLAEMKILVEEGKPQNPDLQRGLAMSLRRVGFCRGELGETDAAQAALERSLLLMQSVSDLLPDDLRRARDVGWSLIYLGQFLLGSGTEEQRDQGAEHYVDASRLIVAVCVAEPGASRYRADVGSVVSAVHEQLLEAGYEEHAGRQLRGALLALQPITEAQPENTALAELHGRLLELQE